MLYAFKTWLEKRGYGDGTIKSRYSNCERIESELGINLDDEFKADEMQRLLGLFEYSRDDVRRGLNPRHGMYIDGDAYNGTATLRSALNLYYQFKKHPEINSQIQMAAPHANRGVRNTLDGHVEAETAAKKLDVDIAKLVALTAIWAPLAEHIACNRGAKDPNVRRSRPGEVRGLAENGIRYDDNTYPNRQMKAAMQRHYNTIVENYETCHVWPMTCYDTRYHTCFANLVLLPREIAAFSDHSERIQKVLQYRAFEIFEWYPEEETKPEKPDNYPTEWLSLDI